MENNKSKLSEIKWWHVIAPGMGLTWIFKFNGGLVIDLLVTGLYIVGITIGLSELRRYIKSKVAKQK